MAPSKPPSRAGSLPHSITVGHKIRVRKRSNVGASLLANRPLRPPKIATIIHVDIHHRRECLPQKNRPVQDQSHPHLNPAPEGQIMLIHLLTCLALTAVTLTLFSRFVLDIGQTEEPTS
jgi:hypothetical protein